METTRAPGARVQPYKQLPALGACHEHDGSLVLMSEPADKTTVNPKHLNPFALPSETDALFRLLVIAAWMVAIMLSLVLLLALNQEASFDGSFVQTPRLQPARRLSTRSPAVSPLGHRNYPGPLWLGLCAVSLLSGPHQTSQATGAADAGEGQGIL